MKVLNKEQKQLTQAQVLRKLQKGGVNSSQQYELIVVNLEQQNLRLIKDRQQLKIRVDILLSKQKQLLQQHKNNANGKKGPTIDYVRLKRQLQHKYKQFELWKKRCYNSINKGALNLQIKDYMNKCAVVEAQIQHYHKIMADQKKTHKKLQKSIKAQLKRLNKNVPQKQLIEEENKQLRRMIWGLRIEEDLTRQVDVRVHSSIVRLQCRNRFVQKLKTMTIQEIKRQEAKSKIQIIKQQIKEKKEMKIMSRVLRQNSERRIKTESRQSINSLKQRQKQDQKIKQKQKQAEVKQQENKKLQVELSTLQKQKDQLHAQYNQTNEILQRQQVKIAQKKNKIQPQCVDVCFQVNQFQDLNPLPLEIVGNETLLLQDDRLVLKNAKDTVITGLIVYQNKSGIACVRALYSNGKQTSCLPPQKYLIEKCKHKKIILNDPKDYLKWIKAYYDKSQNKLVRLEIYSNNKIKFQIGKQKQVMLKNVIPYKFDNSSQQLPVCVRISYRNQEDEWIVSSFGVQVNSR